MKRRIAAIVVVFLLMVPSIDRALVGFVQAATRPFAEWLVHLLIRLAVR